MTTEDDRYGATNASYTLANEHDGLMMSHDDDDDSDDEGEFEMSIQELIYSSASYYAITKPVTITMVLAALAVVFVNNDQTKQEGQAAMANAYQVWQINNAAASASQNLGYSLANALVMVSVICAMTFVIVILYKFKFMKCLIGYMIFCSGTLLGVLGGNLFQVAVHIYKIPIDKPTFAMLLYNFAIVGVVAVFFGKGIPMYVTQGYLIATAVILAWHLSYFDDWTIWTLLFMLALYDLCAVLTPCGPLKALVNLMSQEDSPEMPGLLYEAELPKEAKRPGLPKVNHHAIVDDRSQTPVVADQSVAESIAQPETNVKHGPTLDIPLAIAKVYNLPVVAVPAESTNIIYPHKYTAPQLSAEPLLDDSSVTIPEEPSVKQMRALVTVRLPPNGGRLELVSRRGKKVYLERDRHGNPKRILWVDRNGKVFAEMRGDDEDGAERNSIRLGLGDFIFYSVLVAKAAEYSFATFVACALVILAGLGGTLVLLSVYHHALPALPISILLGILMYGMTRMWIEPWIEAVMSQPYYV